MWSCQGEITNQVLLVHEEGSLQFINVDRARSMFRKGGHPIMMSFCGLPALQYHDQDSMLNARMPAVLRALWERTNRASSGGSDERVEMRS
jgi:hypothetical protein